jgi:4-hydroxybenzoate polyprenyltransferase
MQNVVEKALAIGRLTRLEHGIMLSAAVLIGFLLLGVSEISPLLFLSAMLVPFFVEMGVFALNDVLDVETDRINNRTDRPIVTGSITEKEARIVSGICILAGILLSAFINSEALLITAVFAAFGIIYNYKMKDIPLLGNMFIGTTMGIPFVFAEVAFAGAITATSIYLFCVAFVIGFAREIVKSVEDYRGDMAARGSKTLPVLIGPKKSMVLAGLIFMLFVPVSYFFLISVFQQIRAIALIPLTFAYLIIVYALMGCIFCTGECRDEAIKIKRLTLFAMAIGLLAMVISRL